MRFKQLFIGTIAALAIAGCADAPQPTADYSPNDRSIDSLEQKALADTNYVSIDVKEVMNNPSKYYGKDIAIKGIPSGASSLGGEYYNLSFTLTGKPKDSIIPSEDFSNKKDYMICRNGACNRLPGLNAIAVIQTAHERELEIVAKGKFHNDAIFTVEEILGLGYHIYLNR